MPAPIRPHILRDALDTIARHRLRSLLSGLGIVIGVAAISAVLAVGDGLEAYARAQVADRTNLLSVGLQPRSARTVEGRRVPLREEERFVLDAARLAVLADTLDAACGLAGATLLETGMGEAALSDTTGVVVALLGTLPGGLALGDAEIVAGRGFTQADLDAGAPVCLVSADAAQRLGAASAPKTITLEDVVFEVIGTLAPAEDGPIVVALPQPFLARVDLSPIDRGLPTTVLNAADVEDVPRILATAEAWLDAHHPGWREGADLVAYRGYIDEIARGMLLFKAFMVAITGITLIVGGIGIMNVLLVSVGERTREIGVRRAVGARSADIRHQLLAESVFMCAVGAVIGVALGIGGAYLITWVMRRISDAPLHASVTLPSVVFAVAVSALVGIAFGMYPARRAARLSPVEAIRHE